MIKRRRRWRKRKTTTNDIGVFATVPRVITKLVDADSFPSTTVPSKVPSGPRRKNTPSVIIHH